MKKSLKIKKTVQKAVNSSFKDGQLDKERVKQYINVLKAAPKIESLLFLKEYLKRMQSEIRNKTLVIESPVPLDSRQAQEVGSFYKKNYEVMQTEIKLNPSLLGGIRVRIADVVFDDTVFDKIEEVGKRIGG